MTPITWTQTRIVGDGGKIELLLPELQPGETVEISVRRQAPQPEPLAQRPMGFLKGKVAMAADFDDPLDDFAEYM